MADLSNTIPFNKLLNEIMVTYGYNDDLRRKIGMFLIESIRNHSMLHLPDQKNIIQATVGVNNDVDLPSDCIEFVSLSVNYRNRYWTFTKNDKVIVHTTDSGGEVLDIGLDGLEVSESGSYYSLGERGGKNKFYYVPDFKNNRVFINGDLEVGQAVYLTYISSGVDAVAGSTVIPVKWKDVIKRHVRYLEAMSDSETQEYLIRRFDKDYNDLLLQMRGLDWTLDELADSIYKTSTQTPRRRRF